MDEKRDVKGKSSLSNLFTSDKKREAKLKAWQEILDYGTEEHYFELLVSWNVPRNERQSLLEAFREQRAVKRGLRS